MSNILRSTLKFSIKQLGITSLKLSDGILKSRSPACINHLFNNHFQTSAVFNSQETIEKQIKKLDEDARRTGRISLREVSEVFEDIKTLRFASSTQSLMVIRCCGSLITEEAPEKRTELVQEIWNTFKKLGINLDITHYNALLRVYLENEHPFSPTDILAELEQKGLEPNRVTYQRLITRYCQGGDIEGATRILEFMREKEMPVNEAVFNALVLGHSRANDMENAEGILNVMKQGGIDPTPATYTNLICGYIKQGNLDKVKALLKESELQDIYFSDKDYLEIIYQLAIHNHDVEEILTRVKRSSGYNQEVINYAFRLISADKTEPAFKLLRTMVKTNRLDGTTPPTGGFFITAIVRKDRPVEEIVKYCDILMKENLNPQAFNIAMENSLRQKKEKLSLQLFRAAKERNIAIRPHYFWPLIVKRGKQNDHKGIFDVLNTMSTEFNLPITSETVREYVIPHLLKHDTNIQSLLFDLKSCGCTIANGASAIVLNLLLSGNIKKAAEIASSYRAYHAIPLIRKPLTNSFLKTENVDSFTTILKQIAVGIQWRASTAEAAEKLDEEEQLPEYRESVGSLVNDVVKQLKKETNAAEKVENILKSMLEKGIGLSARAAEGIQNTLQDKLTQEISTLLEKLTTASLQLTEQPSQRKRTFSNQYVSEESLERMYETMKAKGEATKTIQKQLFSMYGRNHDLEKLLKLKEEMDSENFVYTVGMKAYIIDAYVEHEKVDEAWNAYKSFLEKEPDFQLHALKTLRLALLLVKNERYDDALSLLNQKAVIGDVKDAAENQNFLRSSVGWRILNHFAEKGDVEKIHKFFDLIVNNQYCTVNNILLGPLIKVHVVKDDVVNALKEFENVCLKYRATPWKNDLARRCIQSEDASGLQRLTDLSTQVHGETNSLYDLMLSFLECGRIKQAKKILETPGLRLRKDRLQNACQKYQNQGAIGHLENLLAVTQNINSMDRSDLYYNLLLSYDKAGEPQKALSLWMQLQEENEPPSDMFLILLADILKKNDMPVPFNVPEVQTEHPRVQQTENRIEMGTVSKEFRFLLRQGKVDDALKYKSNKKPEQFNNTDLSLLMEALVKDGRLKESKEVLNDLLKRGVLPMTRVLKFFLIQAMIKGDCETFDWLEDKLSTEHKRMTLFSRRICAAYLNAGRADEFVNKLESKLDSANSKEEVEEFLNNFPKGTLAAVLEKHPNLLPQVRRIADKCLERDSKNLEPLNVIWLYHFLRKDFKEADKIWNEYLVNGEKAVGFRGITFEALKKNDLELLEKLKDSLEKKQNCTPGAIGIVYGGIIKVLVTNNKVEEAYEFFKQVLEKVSVDDILKEGLETLKAACIAKDIPFEYEIKSRRSRRQKEADSDSDSD